MKKKLILIAMAVMAVLNLQAQYSTPDAIWCEIIEQTLADCGVQGDVRADVTGGERTLHVTALGRTLRYPLPLDARHPDYSSPICIIVDNLDYRFTRHNDSRESGRAWLGGRGLSNGPDEVFTLPADVEVLQSHLRSTVANVARVQLVDGEFADRAEAEGANLFVMKGNVIAIQRGESFVVPKDAPPAGGPGQRPAPRKLDRKFAYAKIHLELSDYRTGQVVWGSDFSYDDNTSMTSSNPMQNVVDHICRGVASSLQQRYPSVAPRASVSGHVLRAELVKKDKAETVYIDLGFDQELRKGDVLSVCQVNNVAGNEGYVPVGTITVSDVQGPTLTLCKVKKGEKDILAALTSGAALVVEGRLD